eukprot:TRINITY_DN7080_c0_g2_i1.p1 TRINITY_DN7080_c0_g2~~TRINITY_DN7080_c0_g2_i1.p1  ORF type:complete len:1069 (-),score=174.70 TRINITY_DN7080_c0_g2_i1:97-3303(-)
MAPKKQAALEAQGPTKPDKESPPSDVLVKATPCRSRSWRELRLNQGFTSLKEKQRNELFQGVATNLPSKRVRKPVERLDLSKIPGERKPSRLPKDCSQSEPSVIPIKDSEEIVDLEQVQQIVIAKKRGRKPQSQSSNNREASAGARHENRLLRESVLTQTALTHDVLRKIEFVPNLHLSFNPWWFREKGSRWWMVLPPFTDDVRDAPSESCDSLRKLLAHFIQRPDPVLARSIKNSAVHTPHLVRIHLEDQGEVRSYGKAFKAISLEIIQELLECFTDEPDALTPFKVVLEKLEQLVPQPSEVGKVGQFDKMDHPSVHERNSFFQKSSFKPQKSEKLPQAREKIQTLTFEEPQEDKGYKSRRARITESCYPCRVALRVCPGKTDANTPCLCCINNRLPLRMCVIPESLPVQIPSDNLLLCHICGSGDLNKNDCTFCAGCGAVVCADASCRQGSKIFAHTKKWICCHCLGVPLECNCKHQRYRVLSGLLFNLELPERLPKCMSKLAGGSEDKSETSLSSDRVSVMGCEMDDDGEEQEDYEPILAQELRQEKGKFYPISEKDQGYLKANPEHAFLCNRGEWKQELVKFLQNVKPSCSGKVRRGHEGMHEGTLFKVETYKKHDFKVFHSFDDYPPKSEFPLIFKLRDCSIESLDDFNEILKIRGLAKEDIDSQVTVVDKNGRRLKKKLFLSDQGLLLPKRFPIKLAFEAVRIEYEAIELERKMYFFPWVDKLQALMKQRGVKEYDEGKLFDILSERRGESVRKLYEAPLPQTDDFPLKVRWLGSWLDDAGVQRVWTQQEHTALIEKIGKIREEAQRMGNVRYSHKTVEKALEHLKGFSLGLIVQHLIAIFSIGKDPGMLLPPLPLCSSTCEAEKKETALVEVKAKRPFMRFMKEYDSGEVEEFPALLNEVSGSTSKRKAGKDKGQFQLAIDFPSAGIKKKVYAKTRFSLQKVARIAAAASNQIGQTPTIEENTVVPFLPLQYKEPRRLTAEETNPKLPSSKKTKRKAAEAKLQEARGELEAVRRRTDKPQPETAEPQPLQDIEGQQAVPRLKKKTKRKAGKTKFQKAANSS